MKNFIFKVGIRTESFVRLFVLVVGFLGLVFSGELEAETQEVGLWTSNEIGLDRAKGKDPFESFYGKTISGKELNRYFDLLNKHILSFPKHSNDQLDSKGELIRFIEENKISSIAELTEKLPAANKTVLMAGFASESLHESSCAFPRIIASSIGGLLVCSWNGDASQANYDGLECQEFSNKTGKTFHYFTIQFAKDKKERAEALEKEEAEAVKAKKIEKAKTSQQLLQELTIIARETQKIIVNEQGQVVEDPTKGRTTPNVCQTCHQTETLKTSETPAQQNKKNLSIWKQYNKWKGYFGELDDVAESVYSKCREEFQSNFNLPRYKHLPELKRLFDKEKVSDRFRFNNTLFAEWTARLASIRVLEGKTDEEIFEFMCPEEAQPGRYTTNDMIFRKHFKATIPAERYVLGSAKGIQESKNSYTDGRARNATLWETLFAMKPHLRERLRITLKESPVIYAGKSNLQNFGLMENDEILFRNEVNICLGLKKAIENSAAPGAAGNKGTGKK